MFFFHKAPRPGMKDQQKREVTQKKVPHLLDSFSRHITVSTHIPGFWNNMFCYIFVKLLISSATFAETKLPKKESKVHQQANNDHGIMQRNTTIKLHQAVFCICDVYLKTDWMLQWWDVKTSFIVACQVIAITRCPESITKKYMCLGITRVLLNLQIFHPFTPNRMNVSLIF